MRAWEIITEDQTRRPEISLRHLNQLKHINRARTASLARQAALKRTMYANPAREHERIELEKARLELEQQKAELAATRHIAGIPLLALASRVSSAARQGRPSAMDRAGATNMLQSQGMTALSLVQFCQVVERCRDMERGERGWCPSPTRHQRPSIGWSAAARLPPPSRDRR